MSRRFGSPGRHAGEHRAAASRLGTLLAVMIAAVVITPHITSLLSLRSMLLEASFLGLAAFGQTLCVLVGGIDLSIAFIIDTTNLGALWLMNKHMGSAEAVGIMLAVSVVAGMLNGLISCILRGQAVVVTLGIGYIVLGVMEVLTSLGSSSAGAVFGTVPSWIVDLASVKTRVLGVQVPPAAVIAAVIAVALAFWLRRTWLGRSVYAVAGNPVAASRLLVPTPVVWVSAFAISGLMAGIVGILLLGFSGGAVGDIGDQYLFTTVAAVAVGGTSLSGGHGGIGYTVIGVVTLTILTAVLVGSVLSQPMQQVVLGLLILPAVALYGREPRLRMQL